MKTCKVSLLYSSQSCHLLPSHVNRDSIFLLTPLLRIRFSVLLTLQTTLLLHSLNANCTTTIHNTCKGVLFSKSKNVTLHFYHWLIWENMSLHIFLLFHLRRHIKKSGWCFITGSKHLETDKSAFVCLGLRNDGSRDEIIALVFYILLNMLDWS